MNKENSEAVGRTSALLIDATTFKAIGYRLIDTLADLYAGIQGRRITTAKKPSEIRKLIGEGPIPREGADPHDVMEKITKILIDESLYNSHPRFWGYITGTPAPIGVLGDLLASGVNPNVGPFILSPVATEIESQTIQWIAEFTGFPATCGGILVSGGNMANLVGLLAARKARCPWDISRQGTAGGGKRLFVYTSTETHTWIHKAADLSGIGTESIRWIPSDGNLRMDTDALDRAISSDIAAGQAPFMVIGNAGTVSTGVVDPLPEIARIARKHGLWFHVDGAYGALAAGLRDAPPDLKGLSEADSLAVDPHKWLYAPLECGCALVKEKELLRNTFSYKPAYYRFEGDPADAPLNFFENGPQNSRGFRALKVWLALNQAGREGYSRMIGDDIRLSRKMFEHLRQHPEIEVFTQNLSITTFRYRPSNLTLQGKQADEYLNHLNSDLLIRLQQGGEIFVSNAVINGKTLLRACIVNFRTSEADVASVPGIVAREGLALHLELQERDLSPEITRAVDTTEK